MQLNDGKKENTEMEKDLGKCLTVEELGSVGGGYQSSDQNVIIMPSAPPEMNWEPPHYPINGNRSK